MKIVMVHKYWYPRRGAERYVFALREALTEAGHEVIPFSMQHPKNESSQWSNYFVSNLDTEGIRLFQIPLYLMRAFWSREAYRNMRALLEAEKPDLVHAHNIYTHLSPSVLRACKDAGVPVVVSVHDYGMISANYALWSGSESLYPQHMSWWDIAKSGYIKNSFLATAALECIVRVQRFFKMYEKNIDRYIPVSMFVREVLERGGIPPQKMSVLHPFTTMPHVARAEFPQGFFYFGALESNKGIEVALRAIDLVEGDEFLYVAGDGPLKEKVLAHPRVKYLGVLSPQEIAIQLAHTRAVVMPSIWDEPFGLSALEAMLTHTPVIVSLRGALPELVEGGECGIVTKTGDHEALARAMRFVIEQPESARAMAARAYEKAHNVANIENHLRQLFVIYDKALVDKSI